MKMKFVKVENIPVTADNDVIKCVLVKKLCFLSKIAQILKWMAIMMEFHVRTNGAVSKSAVRFSAIFTFSLRSFSHSIDFMLF